MSDFEYLSVLIAIIVGIGFAHLLLSIGRILGETKTLNVTPVHLIWTGIFSLDARVSRRRNTGHSIRQRMVSTGVCNLLGVIADIVQSFMAILSRVMKTGASQTEGYS